MLEMHDFFVRTKSMEIRQKKNTIIYDLFHSGKIK